MVRAALLLILGALVGCLCGCASSGISTPSNTSSVNIQATRFFPSNIQVSQGSTVLWTNVDSQPHQVVSGTLNKVSNTQVRPAISITPTNTFLPSASTVNFGDTVQWRNDRSTSFILDVVSDSGNVVASFSLVPGQTASLKDFPAAGMYTAQQQGNPLFAGTVTLVGVPAPNGLFTSPVLQTGGTFSTIFNTTGSFDYFDSNPANPSQPFMTGVVNVQ